VRTLAALVAGAACVNAAPVPTPIGSGPRYQLPAVTARVASGATLGGFTCTRGNVARIETHVELFADKRALLFPTGIGVSKRNGCSYAARTESPTGVIESLAGAKLTVADLFAIWGQPLSHEGFAGFRGAVHAWVGGCPWSGSVRSIPLAEHAEIVLEVGGYIPPHRSFLFPS
jgi:hypothetical protein